MGEAINLRWFLHSKKRARERYGMRVNWRVHEQIIQKVRAGEFEKKTYAGKGRFRYILYFQLRLIKIIIDPALRQTTTFCPKPAAKDFCNDPRRLRM